MSDTILFKRSVFVNSCGSFGLCNFSPLYTTCITATKTIIQKIHIVFFYFGKNLMTYKYQNDDLSQLYHKMLWWRHVQLSAMRSQCNNIGQSDSRQSSFSWLSTVIWLSQKRKTGWWYDLKGEGRLDFCLVVKLSFPLCFWLGSHPTVRRAPGMLVLAALRQHCTVQKENPLKHYSPDSSPLLTAVFPYFSQRESSAR